MKLLVMSKATADSLTTATVGKGAELRPRLIDAGPQAGSYALGLSALTDAAFTALKGTLNGCTQVDIDTTLAWPNG
jgi:hypothetical protein